MTTTSKKEIGNHLLASDVSKSRYWINYVDLKRQEEKSKFETKDEGEGRGGDGFERTRSDFEIATQVTQTAD